MQLPSNQYNGQELLENIGPWPEECPITITGLSSDSRQTKPGDLFIAFAGPPSDRPLFIREAISKGAVAVIRDSNTPGLEMQERSKKKIPIIDLPDVRKQAGLIAAKFYGNPTASMRVIGITGTNGKTSCSQFIAAALSQAGVACGIIGTLGTGFPNQLEPGYLTTPDPLSLQRQLAYLKQQGAKAVAMEVSSHSLDQNRVAGVQFDTAIFTNLTRDHLDYHGDMEHYGAAKRLMFLQPGLKTAVLNLDDAFGLKLAHEFSKSLTCYGYSIEQSNSDIPTLFGKDIKFNHHGFTATIQTPWGEGSLHSGLLGRFNVSNLLAALSALCVMDIPLQDALNLIAKLQTISGRMQAFGGGKQPLVVVDYAHTPDALEKALTALREHCNGKLWCVFGCGGNRDAGKRALMGKTAERFSDQIIITDDNPRFENPEHITNQIVEGLLCPWAAEIVHDRQAAIAHAIECAQPGDVVLIAGKGHERYQQIGAERIPFNDAEQVQKQLME
jgi:UDP-N-acetylmuramoyl-L-alanyl-D-glutamate--2,6-diaminopimelate ligase